jgi:hypothetical protein
MPRSERRDGTDAGDYEAVSTPLLELHAGDRPEAWAGVGFAVDADGACRIGQIVLHLDGSGGGLKAWTLSGPPGPDSLDGLPTRWELPRGPVPVTAADSGWPVRRTAVPDHARCCAVGVGMRQYSAAGGAASRVAT